MKVGCLHPLNSDVAVSTHIYSDSDFNLRILESKWMLMPDEINEMLSRCFSDKALRYMRSQ